MESGSASLRRALIYQGDAVVSAQIQSALQAVGFEIFSFTEAKRAVACIASSKVDVAILDLAADDDGILGVGAAALICGVPIIFCGNRLLPTGFVGSALVAKPFSHAQILEAVEAV